MIQGQAQAEVVVVAEQAENAGAISERYVPLTVIFDSVLFIGGISGRFQSWFVDAMMLVLSFGVFAGAVVLLSYPIQ